MYVRSKEMNGRTYYQVVRGYRDAESGQVRHETVISLGTQSSIAEALRRAKARLTKARKHRNVLGPGPFGGRLQRRVHSLDRRIDEETKRTAILKDLLTLSVEVSDGASAT